MPSEEETLGSSRDQTSPRCSGKAEKRRGDAPGLQWARSTYCGPHAAPSRRPRTQSHTTTRYTQIQYWLSIWQNTCAQMGVCIPSRGDTQDTQDTHHRAAVFHQTHRRTNKQRQTNKQTADSHNGCHTNGRPSSSSLSLGKAEIDRVRDLEREREREKEWVGECQHSTASKQQQQKKKNPKTSEHVWVDYNYTTSQGSGAAGGKEGRKEGRREGAWGERRRRRRNGESRRCHTFQTFITLNKYLHMGTYSTQNTHR